MILWIAGACFVFAALLKLCDFMIPAHANVNLNVPIGVLLFAALALIVYHYWPMISS